MEPSGLPPVWPYSKGTVRGLEFEPLHPMVPEAVLADAELGRLLALVDSLRSNDSARITQLVRSGGPGPWLALVIKAY